MPFDFLIVSAMGVLVAGGIYLALRARPFQVVLGLTLIFYAVTLFLFPSGRLMLERPPIWDKTISEYSDPLPQALVLTAIVITFGMTAFVVILALRSFLETGSDHVDGDKGPCDAQDGLADGGAGDDKP
ncbi:MAG: Na+/H+ antiporter subunit C [Porphyrobacter sp.]|nr:Na+/H+ antiporter subunit C [Porphyrobacter sp.]